MKKHVHVRPCVPRGVSHPRVTSVVCALIGLVSAGARAQTQAPEPEPGHTKSLGVVVVTSGQSTSLPTHIPTTLETVTAQQMAETLNATDSEDALKYLPSLSVRKRFAGDYNHAVLASRASGSQNAARSAVYADGMLISNFVGNDKFYAPRWGMVNPSEIERVDVMYGPFSAAYPGNSVGAVVDYTTRMPQAFEAHVRVGAFNQRFDAYNTDTHFGGAHFSASLGSRVGDWSYWFHASRLDNSTQPLVFATAAPGAAGAATAVTGVVPASDTKGNPGAVLGTATQYHTVQDHTKIKLAYDLSSTLRASYTLGVWQNASDGNPSSYLRNATSGAPVYSGVVSNGTSSYNLSATALNASREALMHTMHGFSLKSNTQAVFDWEVLASLYDYQQDLNRSSASNTTNALYAGSTPGKLTDYGGTGWHNLALKGTWRPEGVRGAHIVDFGYQQDAYKLRIQQNTTGTSTWETAPAGALTSRSAGESRLDSVYAQDAWKFAPRWRAVWGVRAEQWRTRDGLAQSTGNPVLYAERQETHLSPKLAVSHLWADDWVLKASTGRSVRMPTVHELYGSTSAVSTSVFYNDPNLRPERAWTTELSAEKDMGTGLLRMTAFFENTRDAIASQVTATGLGTSAYVQNIQRIESSGMELAYNGNDVLRRGLDVLASVTYTDSRIKENEGYVSAPGDTLDKYQIRVPVWRANALANYHWSQQLSTSLGGRYAGRQFGQLNNSDINGFAYMGNSKFFVVDARLLYKVDKQWAVAAGVDNLNGYRYWNFHPYPMRTYHAELRFDL